MMTVTPAEIGEEAEQESGPHFYDMEQTGHKSAGMDFRVRIDTDRPQASSSWGWDR